MKRAAFLAALFCFGAATNAFSEDGTRAEAGYSHEWLGNGFSDWQTSYARVDHATGKSAVYGGARETTRFGLKDDAFLAGGAFPVFGPVSMTVEGEVCGSHNVLPIWTGLAEFQSSIGPGWAVAAGIRRTEYPDSRINIGDLRLEKYIGNFRFAYTNYPVSSDVGGSVDSNAFSVDWYFGEKNFVRAGYSNGREIEGAGPIGLLVDDIEEYTLSGRDWVAPHWAFTFDLGSHRQGTVYTRKWAGLGLLYGF